MPTWCSPWTPKNARSAEIELHTHGATIHGKEETEDMYSAIDLVIDNVKRQVQKHKGQNQAQSPDRAKE